MYCRDHPASALQGPAYRLNIFAAPQLIHRQYLGRHRTDQHHHAKRFRASIHNVRTYADIILRAPHVAARDFGPLVHHSYIHPPPIAVPIRYLPYHIPEKSCLAAARRRNQKGIL